MIEEKRVGHLKLLFNQQQKNTFLATTLFKTIVYWHHQHLLLFLTMPPAPTNPGIIQALTVTLFP